MGDAFHGSGIEKHLRRIIDAPQEVKQQLDDENYRKLFEQLREAAVDEAA